MKGKKKKKERKKWIESKYKANRNDTLWKIYEIISKLCKNSKWEYCCDLVVMIKKEFGEDHLYSEIIIGDDKPYTTSTVKNNGNVCNIKVSKKFLSGVFDL